MWGWGYGVGVEKFNLIRFHDATGISGTGVVAQGVRFDDGTVALRWLTVTRSTAIYASMVDLVQIHGHDGATKVEYLDEGGQAGEIEKLWRVAFDYHGRPASWWTSRDYGDALARLNEARVDHREMGRWPNLRLEVRESVHGPWLPVEGM